MVDTTDRELLRLCIASIPDLMRAADVFGLEAYAGLYRELAGARI